MRKNLIIGNWKMNGNKAQNELLLQSLAASLIPREVTVAVCAPFPYLFQCQAQLQQTCFLWGAQNISEYDDGAYTGEVSAAMLADLGCKFSIVGHSERRQYLNESNEQVALKALKALEHDIVPIVCVGETLDEKEAGLTHAVVSEQLAIVLDQLGAQASSIIVAYEPIWAIGTGKTATPAEAQGVHAQLRAQLISADAGDVPILYGGSVKPDNVAALMSEPDIDGGLIGGASLNAEDFLKIIDAVVA